MKKLAWIILLVSSVSSAGVCETRSYSHGVESTTGTIKLQPRSNSGTLGDGYTYSVTDAPGTYIVQITDASGVVSEASGAISQSTPVSISVKDSSGNGKSLSCSP